MVTFCLLSTHNVTLLAQIIHLRTQFPDYPIKKIHLDNTNEFSSQSLIDHYMSIGINIKHLITRIHTQNGLVESLIKRLELIA